MLNFRAHGFSSSDNSDYDNLITKIQISTTQTLSIPIRTIEIFDYDDSNSDNSNSDN